MPSLSKTRSKVQAVISTISFAALLVLPVTLAAQSPLKPAKHPAQTPVQAPHHAPVGRRVIGVGGVQTGTASFLGNFTQIAAPNQKYFALQRQPDCSLTYYTGTSSNSGVLTITTSTPHYEQVLHQLASLTTTPDVFAKGCPESSAGIGSRLAIYTGQASPNLGVFAGAVLYNASAGTNTVATAALNFTNGHFTTAKDSSGALNNATALATGDLNGDGIGDLVVVNNNLATTGSIDVLLGKSDGTFQTPVSYAAPGTQTVAAVIDDVNGDGKLDIVVVSDDSTQIAGQYQQISVYLGNGNGTFQAAQSFAAPPAAGFTTEGSAPIVGLITADLRGNGKKDIVCSNGVVLLGNGNGTFTASATPAFPYHFDDLSQEGPNLAVGDLNNDGKLDLVLDDSTAIYIYLGNADGTFTQGASYAGIENSGFVTVTDLDGDGNLDIYSGIANGGFYSGDDDTSDAYVLMGRGDGTFVGAPLIGSGGSYTGWNLGDVNGDGVPDIITSNQGSPITVQLGDGKGNFIPTSTITPPNSVAIGGDVITGAATAAPDAYAVGDLNGDGKADLVFVDNNLIYNNGLNTYPYPVLFTAMSKGDGTFTTPVAQAFPQIAPATGFDISNTISGVQIADFNHDGYADLIFTFNEVGGGPGVTNPYQQGFLVLPGKSDGTYGTPLITTTYSGATANATANVPSIAAIGDLNGDDKPDFIAINPSFSIATGATNSLLAFINNGDGSFKAPTTLLTTAGINQAILTDVNKDGKLDLLSVSQTAAVQGQLSIALGNGNGTFAAPTILNLAGYPGGNGIAVADFDGDGLVDIALQSPQGFSGVFYGKGGGAFSSIDTGNGLIPVDLIDVFLNGGSTIAVDLNKDGKPDILAGNVILLNIYGSTPISPASTTTALTAPTTSITAGASITFTATITPATGSTGIPTGSVNFFNGATSLGTGTVTAGVATLTTTALSAGSDSITAVYSGDANFTGSTSPALVIAVAAAAPVATTTTLTSSATSAVSGTSITFTAQVAPASGATTPTGNVTFLDGATTLGAGALDGTGKATYTTSALSVGAHSITASYPGAAGFSASTSTALSVTITAASTGAFAVSLSPTSGSVASGSSAASTISVTPSGGFNSAVSLACSGAPTNSTCTIGPTSVTPDGTNPATASLTIQTGVQAAALQRPFTPGQPNTSSRTALAFLGGGMLLGFTLLRRRRASWYAQLGLGLFFAAASAVVGCGGSGSSGGGGGHSTPSGAYTLTVTATAGSNSHTATYSLTVQ